MIKGSIQEEDRAIVNIYAPNIGAPQYLKQMLTAIIEKINNNSVLVEDFNTPLTPIDRHFREKINKETSALNITLDQIDLTDIYRHSIQKQQNILSSQAYTEHSPG